MNKKINRQLISLVAVLAVALFFSQFVVLATVGTKGAEVSKIRISQSALRKQNEGLRAEIDKSRTQENIALGLDVVFDLQETRAKPKEIKAIEPAASSVVGQIP